MAITEEFKQIIEEDIAKCESEIKAGDKATRYQLHCILLSKYSPIIDKFQEELKSLFYDSDGQYCLQNLEVMRQKLILFRAMGYDNAYQSRENTTELTINNQNQLSINMNITFPEARTRIENMTALQESDIQEILEKIDALELIVNSTNRKSKKWDDAKEIIKWIADKGVDVGLTFLPLLLGIG